MNNYINNPKIRSLLAQIILFLLLVFLVYSALVNVSENLASQNKNFGFGFLSEAAGFKLNFSLISHDETVTYGGIFVIGVLNTILVAILGIFIASILGFVIGIARLSKNLLVSKIALYYVEVMRNIPLLLHIFFWYFAVFSFFPPIKKSINFFDMIYINNRGVDVPKLVLDDGAGYVLLTLILSLVGAFFLGRWAKTRQNLTGKRFPSFIVGTCIIIFLPLVVYFLAGSPMSLVRPELKGFNFVGGVRIVRSLFAIVAALSIYTAAYIAEIVRSGILAVNYGQTEAAYSLGFSRIELLRLIIIPQALRVVVPPLTNQYLNLTKNSSLSTAIAYQDLVAAFAGTVLNQTGRAIEIIFMTMLVYLFLSLLTSFLMNIYNKKMALVER